MRVVGLAWVDQIEFREGVSMAFIVGRSQGGLDYDLLAREGGSEEEGNRQYNYNAITIPLQATGG